MKVSIVESQKHFHRFLQETINNNDKVCHYLLWEEIAPSTLRTLELSNFVNVDTSHENEAQRDEFLTAYVDFIGELSTLNHCKEWWATDIASKNRFKSKLPDLLHQFVQSLSVIEKLDVNHIAIINPSFVIIDSLEEELKRKNIDYVVYGNKIKRNLNYGLSIIKKVGALFLGAGEFYIRGLKAKWHLGEYFNKNVSKDSCYVIKNFTYDHSFDQHNKYQDAFFGRLPEYLKEKRNVVLLTKILGNFDYCIKQIKTNKSFLILPIEMFVGLFDVFTSIVKVLFYRVKTPSEIKFFGYDIGKIVRNDLIRTFNGIQIYQYLNADCINRFVKEVNTQTFLYTYENQPWERMCLWSLRQKSPSTKVLGYQHAVVAQAHMNLYPSIKEKDIIPLPNKILTVGPITDKTIKRFGCYEDGLCEPVAAFRYEYLKDQPAQTFDKKGNILVVLGGSPENYELINYVIMELGNDPEYNVVIRSHPVMPWSDFEHKFRYNIDSFSNIKISNTISLQDDINWSDMVLFWESTVGLEALSMGKPIIHFQTNSVLSFDPIPECNHLKWVVSRVDALKPLISDIYEMSADQMSSEYGLAKQYLQEYFPPVTDQNIGKFELVN